MPTYAYRCGSCGHQFDAFQRFADDPLRDCPTCVGAVRRVIQPVGVVFKGSGWYINDSRPKPADEGRSAAKKDGPEAKTDGKADAKTGGEATEAKTTGDKNEPKSGADKPAAEKSTTKSDAPAKTAAAAD